MLEAVLPIAIRTANANGIQGVDIGLAARMRTLRGSQESRLARTSTICCWRERSSFPLGGRPLAGARAFVSCFGAMVEAVSAFARFAPEGKEVKLVAINVLAMGANCLEVFVHAREGLGFRRWWGCRR